MAAGDSAEGPQPPAGDANRQRMRMRLIVNPDHRHHAGRNELRDGILGPSIEAPERVEVVLAALDAVCPGPVEPPDFSDDALIAAVHDREYVAFLRSAWPAWVAARGDGADALPLAWPVPGLRPVRPNDIDGRLGYYAFDAGTPITAGTWIAARSAAMAAATAADRVADGCAAAFALCRPPGHHAGRRLFGGYCYLNNAAIAAERLRARGAGRVAIIDVDYHHGNGTQDIFWTRPDVLFVSLHADPREEFPYFAGHADEAGAGPGEDLTVNFPLPIGTDWSAYAPALATAIRKVRRFGPDAVVVSLGVDAWAGDPICRFRLDTDDYRRIGEALAGLARPTVIVFEGGYALEGLGGCVIAALDPFSASRPECSSEPLGIPQ